MGPRCGTFSLRRFLPHKLLAVLTSRLRRDLCLKFDMQIENNKVVAFHYTLQVVGEEYTEDSSDGDPMLYLQGHRGVLPGLEDAMAGKSAGDKFSVEISPQDGYGLRNEDGFQRVPVKHLIGQKTPAIGEIVTVNTTTKKVQATVVKVGRHTVDVDNNHPLAGKQLKFDIEVVSVRAVSYTHLTLPTKA